MNNTSTLVKKQKIVYSVIASVGLGFVSFWRS